MRAGQAEVDRLGGAGAQRTHLHTRRDVQPVVRVAGRAVTILANILNYSLTGSVVDPDPVGLNPDPEKIIPDPSSSGS